MITPDAEPQPELRWSVGASWLSFTRELTAENLLHVMVENAVAACEAGFVGVEVPLPHAEHLFDSLSDAFWVEARSAMAEAGAPVTSVHGPNLPPLEGHDTTDVARWLERYARLTNLLGADALVVHPTADSHPHVCDRVPRLLERDRTVCRAAADQLDEGSFLAVENLPTYGLAYLERLMDELPHPRVGVCFDTGHWHVRPEGHIREAVARFAGRRAHLHFSDNHGLCDEHLPPGDGTFPWSDFMSALPDAWRTRPALIELSVPLAEQSPDAWAQTRRAWVRAYETANQTIAASQPLTP